MRGAALVLAMALGLALAAQPELTLKQVTALIAAAPDTVVANEVHRRGLNAPLTAQQLAAFQKAGAGPQTMRALKSLVVTQPLVVRSNQATAQVMVDDKPSGITDASGHLTLTTLDPGRHHIVVQKTGYNSADLIVSLSAGKPAEVLAQLQRNTGVLIITTNAAHAQIEVEGVGGQAGPVFNRELPPGSYTVRASAANFIPASKTVTLEAGDTLNVAISLQLDPAFTRNLLAQAWSQSRAGDWNRASAIASSVLQLEPNNGTALSLMATRDFYSGDYAGFVQYGLRALQNGAELEIPVVHHHTFRLIHRAVLKIGSDSLTFDPGASCNQQAFTAPLTSIRAVDLRQDQNGQRYLNLKVVDPRTGRQIYLLFADYRATVAPTGRLQAPTDAAAEITAVSSLIQQQFRNGH